MLEKLSLDESLIQNLQNCSHKIFYKTVLVRLSPSANRSSQIILKYSGEQREVNAAQRNAQKIGKHFELVTQISFA